MSVTRLELLKKLDSLGLAHHTVEHPPIFTVEEGAAIKAEMPGGHSKNLFLKDKKGNLALAVALSATKVDLVGLGKAIGAKGRFSFGKPDLMMEILGVTPGSVTPFCLINPASHHLQHVIFDKALFEHDPVWFHPLENTASTSIAPQDIIHFAESCGHTPKIIDLSQPLPASG